ncbi:hypothetical protein PspLS_07157 [Pyricularia sp. CBS 133598]|nr:hypothetical protein PspLS_07157 [Pyricularia sp. CBS 133598]
MDVFNPSVAQLLATTSGQSTSPLGSEAEVGLQSGTSEGPEASLSGESSASHGGAPSVPAACLACRGKHLKCDGATPCSRCVASASECVYIASRRGYKGPRKSNVPHNPNKRFASSPTPGSAPDDDSCPMLLGASPSGSTVTAGSYSQAPALSQFVAPPVGANMQLYRNPFLGGGSANNSAGSHMRSQLSMPERCLTSFYQNFHASHPCVLPRDALERVIREGPAKLEHLLAAMRYIGSLYLDAGPARAQYFEEAVSLAYHPGCPRDGFLAQTLLLLSIGQDGSCNQARANQFMGDAERLAVEIGLNTRQFATANGRGSSVVEESWRRTWWELYVVNGMIAGVHRITHFALYDVAADVGLPCEEHQFLSGNIPMPMYMEDFDDQLFSGEDREFSSFAYRIASARNLGRMMRTPPMLSPDDDNLAKLEALLTNWKMHLPRSRQDALNKKCQLDEMMFQALFINHACTIMLHQPHSQLDSSPSRSVTSCAPHMPVSSGDAFNAHTRHTVTAACEVSRMVTHAVPLLSHTHFFTCVLTLSSIVHLNKWALYFLQDEDDLRQQIRLNIGALQRISAVWQNAAKAGGQVRGVAQEIYRAKKAQQISPAFWVAFTQEQMLSSLNADEGIMNDFDSILPAAQVTQP